jgi:FkbM family methyltransferase
MQDTPSTTTFYSHHGEDVILNTLFKGRNAGVFVEVGCIDGRCLSNTLTFEERGWSGLCVEANARYIDLLRKNRPNSIICHCAAGAHDEESVPFGANSRDSLPTLDPSQEAGFRSRHGASYTGFEKQTIGLRRLDGLFKEHGFTAIDIVSIDIDGSEVDALRGIDLTVYRPSVFVIEASSPDGESTLDGILAPQGYVKVYQVSTSIFYASEEFVISNSISDQRSVTARVIHTRQPLDSGSDKIADVNLDLTILNLAFRTAKSNGPTTRATAKTPSDRYRFVEAGFHGDQYLLQLVDFLVSNCRFFVETGTNVGSTLAYVARKYPQVECLSCEPDAEAYRHAVRNAGGTNVRLFNETSQDFIERLSRRPSIFEDRVLFWLDAHGYGFQWPLRQEIAFITSRFKAGYILIDDFKVPNEDTFGFDRYGDQECSFEYVRDSIDPAVDYNLYYPNYREKTSRFHPLRGWGLLTFGNMIEPALPGPLQHLVGHAVRGASNKESAVRSALSCGGSMDQRKLSLLYDLARQTRSIEGDILEIGSASGRNTVLLGLSAPKTVWTIDPQVEELECISQAGDKDSHQEFLQNIRKNRITDRVRYLRHTTAEKAASSLIRDHTQFALVFISGIHTPESVRINAKDAFSRLVESGIMVFDNYFESGVKVYADEIDRLAEEHQVALIRDESSKLVYFRKSRSTMQNANTNNHQHLISRILNEPDEESAGSVGVTDPKIIARFIANPENTFLVSFPRTGSHWLRLIMELYFERPSLVRAFYYPDRTDYLSLHTHDMDLGVQRRDVIYLYRDPVDTIYSQLGYHKESADDTGRIHHWANLYGRHLDKWLWTERVTTHKTLITYEGLKNDFAVEFAKVTAHFGKVLDPTKLSGARDRTGKDEVKRKTSHDQQVINTSAEYGNRRSDFRTRHATLVWEIVLAGRPHLKQFFR